MTSYQEVAEASGDRPAKKRLRLTLLILCIFVRGGELFDAMAFIVPDFMGAP